MRRVFLIVIDALGIGAMPDAQAFGDSPACNTLGNVAARCGGLALPTLQRLGLGNLCAVAGVPPAKQPLASVARLFEASQGKDTTTGHWELAGLTLETPFQVFRNGFPKAMIDRFVAETGCGGVLGNIAASGTEIIVALDDQHRATGHPIVYTSADSVFQVATHCDVVPLETLYAWCETARRILDDGYSVSRVIARPYEGTPGALRRIASGRHDYSVPPPDGSLLDRLHDSGAQVIGVGKISDIFLGRGISHSIPTGGNREGLDLLLRLAAGDLDFDAHHLGDASIAETDRVLVFANLVDTDMLYGHRNDPEGYGAALEEIDAALAELLPMLRPDDLMLITGDHGCDPTMPGTDHTREMTPLLAYAPGIEGEALGDKPSFSYAARRAADWLGVEPDASWAA